MRFRLVILLFLPFSVFAQTLSGSQQKTLNDAIEFLNACSADISGAVPKLIDVYNDVNRFQENQRGFVQPYKCTIDLKDYYFNEASKSAGSLGKFSAEFNKEFNLLLESYKNVIKICQSLEIYFRLQDYKSDEYKRFYIFVSDLEKATKEYSKQSRVTWETIQKIYLSIQPLKSDNPYHVVWRLMNEQIIVERDVLDTWTINLNAGIHTGWPVEMLKKQVLEDDKLIEALKQKIPEVKYPASSQIKASIGGLESLQQNKRNGIDDYTFENQKSDQHANKIHNYLQNYYDGVVVSHFNMFVKYATQDGFRGIYFPVYSTNFEVKSEVEAPDLSVKPFTNISHAPVTLAKSSTEIPASTFTSLSLYVDYINECVRQFKNSMPSVRSLNGYASRTRKGMREGRKVNLPYYDKDFEVPVTLYQRVIESSGNLPTPIQQSLKDQAAVIHAIITEWSQWTSVLLDGAENKTLDLDSGEFVYNVINRYKVLLDEFDARKEQLYRDLRIVYDSYKPGNPASSWSKAGNALLELTDLDKEQLLIAREYYTADPNVKTSTTKIDETLREVIADEYSNMAGIRKLGRSNGRCPYTPYEDIPVHSRDFAEKLNQLKPTDQMGNSHPYHRLVYIYNDIVDDYNKFCTLSEVKLLQHPKQLEFFMVDPPVLGPVSKPARSLEPIPERKDPAKSNTQTQKDYRNGPGRDTIYIERRDTVYLREPPENLRSMEGYASNNMVLLLDVSGSMNSPQKLPLLKESLLNILGMMREEDEVSIVAYSGKAKVLLQPVSFSQDQKIRNVIGSLESSGKTDVNAGLKLAYQVADKNYIRGGNNRIILATDGEFPLGAGTMKLIQKFADQDIFISVFNFGQADAAARNLQKLSDIGRGNYELITPENAEFKLIQEVKSKRKQ